MSYAHMQALQFIGSAILVAWLALIGYLLVSLAKHLYNNRAQVRWDISETRRSKRYNTTARPYVTLTQENANVRR